MAGKIPSKDIYPAIERMLANALAWDEEGLDTAPPTRPAVSCEQLAQSPEVMVADWMSARLSVPIRSAPLKGTHQDVPA